MTKKQLNNIFITVEIKIIFKKKRKKRGDGANNRTITWFSTAVETSSTGSLSGTDLH